VVYRVSKVILVAVLRRWFGFQVEGRDHEPADGPVVVVCNHRSDLDPLVVGAALRRRVTFMAKQELFRVPGVRWWISACGAFPVRRGEADRQALRTALRILTAGGVLVMFPEGTRGVGPELRPPEPGAALLALRTGAAVLPVAITGTNEVMPRGSHWPRRSTIRIRIGEPVQVPAPQAGDNRARPRREEIDTLGRHYMGQIEHLLTTRP